MDDISYVESWVSQPDVCRCCMSASGTWDVTTTYVNKTGDKEVYSDMLQECYGITLSLLVQWGSSRMVCGMCVTHLRDAIRFRRQVLEAEQQFVAFKNTVTFKPVVLKVDTPREKKSSDCSDIESDAGTIDVLGLTETTDRPVIDRVLNKYNLRYKKKQRMESNEDIDSDTPISEISKKNHVSKNIAGNNDDNLDKNSEPPVTNLHVTRPQQIKHISERKRVILTCDTVLRDTTACPFRHHKSWFQCFFCQEDFMEINLLREHNLKIHSNIDAELKRIKRYPRSLQIEISNLECRRCHLNLTDVASMRCHFVEAHEKVIYTECIADYKVNGVPYSCHLCSSQFHVFRSLTTHLNEHYANCICDVCGKSFLNSKRLKVHKRTHENGHYPCSECGKILKTQTSKANHIESAHSKRIIKCQICFEPMKHYNDRIRHMSEVHNITHKFICPICSREYNIKHYLATHIRQTHGHRNKKCSECGMAFITNHSLKKHMLKHSGVKPFSCNICLKSYARSYTLKEHMRSHGNEKLLPSVDKIIDVGNIVENL